MKTNLLAIGVLLLSLTPFAAHACPEEGTPGSLSYMRRDDNRCEGLLDRNATSSLQLISFVTSDLNRYPEILDIRVPGTENDDPRIEVQSLYRNYRLDNLETTASNEGVFFDLNTSILQKANIPVYSLRAIAPVMRQSKRVYYPVILGEASQSYEFILYSPRRLTFPTLEIRRNNQVVYSDSREIPDRGEIRLTWEGEKFPAGDYELHVVDGNGNQRVFQFYHDPNWL
jgi:flagellar basal-body rod modification protein FlgD